MIPRLTTELRVGALLRRAHAAGAFAAVLQKGDPVAGAVILVARDRAGGAVAWARVTRGDAAVWACTLETTAEDEPRMETHLARQRQYDPDVWIIELITDEIQPLVAEPFDQR